MPLKTQQRLTAREFLAFGVWLGVAYGFLEGAEYVFLGAIPGALSWRTGNAAHVLWVAPLVYGAAFSVLTILALALSRVFRRVDWDVVLFFVLVVLGGFLAASLQGQVFSDLASALLAVGVGTELTRQYLKRREAVRGWIARSLRYLVSAIVVVALAVVGTGRLSERWAMKRLPAVSAKRPNVLLLVMDTQRASHLSAYGYQRKTTPRLDALAREGLLFDNASASSSWTLPTHATIMTGRFLHEHRAGVLRRPYLDGRFPTLAEVLRHEGYATAGFVANTFWCGRQTGLDRGFIRYEDFYGNVGDALARTVLGRRLAYEILPRFGFIDVPGRKRADEINDDLLRWLNGVRDERPFFAFVNYFDVHGPLLPPAGYAGRFGGNPVQARASENIDIGALTPEMGLPSADEIQALVDAYDESLLFLDAEIGALLDELKARKILDNTLVIVTSDHGESWGEHGLMYHGHSLYRDQTHVPLIMRFPGVISAGVREPRPVSVQQIPATVARLVGVEENTFSGLSLNGDLGPTNAVLTEVGRRSLVRSFWPTSRTSLAALVTDRWHFIQPDSGDAELYDIIADPNELNDLAPSRASAGLVARLRSELRQLRSGASISSKVP